MFHLINIFFILILISSYSLADERNQKLNPEIDSRTEINGSKTGKGENFVIVSANQLATDGAKYIIKSGGNAVDAAVTLQLILGLVEPQSSGIGGGTFALYYNNKTKEVFHYEGREKAPKDTSPNVFLDEKGKPKKFFEAVIGGQSVGVPGTLETIFKIHKDFGLLPWKKVIEPAIKLSQNGFIPPNRLIKSLKKERYLWDNLPPQNIFTKILKNPNQLVKNLDYSVTLQKISENYRDFYSGDIAKDIINIINKSKKNPGNINHKDMSEYSVKKSQALCNELKNYIICGPKLPSSGGILITQALMLFENYKFDVSIPHFQKLLNILSFVYYQRDKHLGDPEFQKIDVPKLLDLNYLKQEFTKFQKKKNDFSFSSRDNFHSTSHFSVYDTFGNVVSVTSSIENAFGSRLFVNGFFLNNQLTDFSFKPKIKNKQSINSVEGGKKPLSSMSPIIILDKNKDFLFSTGSPGGIAIISYVFKTIIDVFHKRTDPMISIINGNFVSKSNKLYLEKNAFNRKDIENSLKKGIEIKEIPLTSGIAIIKKEGQIIKGYADIRRDGTVYAE